MIKNLVVLGLIGIFLLSGCEQIKELYGIAPAGEEEYIPLEEIKVAREENVTELPPMPPEEGLEEIVIEEIPKEEPEEMIVEEKEVEEIPKMIEITEGEPAEAKVIIVKETDLVSLKPKATDPDADTLSFSYTTPLNKEGRWQTTYGDAGEYTVTLTASDGELSATKDVLIIVNKKEESPVIDETVPKEEALESKENSKIEFSVKASDLNKDPLQYSWKLDGIEKSKEQRYTYEINYDAAGQHTVKILVTDGVKEASKIWSIKVENVNRKPILEKIAAMRVKENEKIILEPKATDPDNDKITFTVDSDKFKQVDGRFEWGTTYDDAGEYSITLRASDGSDEVSQIVKITVENVNRAPVIDDIILE